MNSNPPANEPSANSQASFQAISNNLTGNIRMRGANPAWRDRFRSDRYVDYEMYRPLWTSRWWQKPPRAVKRRLPTHAGYRLEAPQLAALPP